MTDLDRLRSLMRIGDDLVEIDRQGVADTVHQLLTMDDAQYVRLMTGVDVASLPQWCQNALTLRAKQRMSAPTH